MTVTPAQLRAARGLLGVSQAGLAELAGVGIATLRRVETGSRDIGAVFVDAIVRAAEKEGVSFFESAATSDGKRVAAGVALATTSLPPPARRKK